MYASNVRDGRVLNLVKPAGKAVGDTVMREFAEFVMVAEFHLFFGSFGKVFT